MYVLTREKRRGELAWTRTRKMIHTRTKSVELDEYKETVDEWAQRLVMEVTAGQLKGEDESFIVCRNGRGYRVLSDPEP